MKFNYIAKKGLDKVVKGEIEAVNQEEALVKLAALGLYPTHIELAAGTPSPKQPIKSIALKGKFSRKITSAQIVSFTQKLNTLIKSHVELLEALQVIYEQTENSAFQEIILQIYNATKEGKAFSESLSRFPKVFSNLYVNIIRAGEASGALDAALTQISEFLSREENLRKKVSVALAYPILLLIVGFASILVLIGFVIPRLKPIFAGLGKDLPPITKFILSLSGFFNQHLWVVLTTMIILALIIYAQRHNPVFPQLMRRVRMKLPIIKKLANNQEMAQLSRSLCLLLRSGVAALKALDIVIPGIEDPTLQQEMRTVYNQVASGQSVSDSMAKFTRLPNFFTKMIAIGEKSGNLTQVLDEISNFYNQEIESNIALISSLLEPILILVLGLFLGTIVLSILLPTFQVTQFVS